MKRSSIARPLSLVTALALAACGSTSRGHFGDGGGGGSNGDGSATNGADGGNCESELSGCYTVYAHSDHVLYRLDLANKLIVEVGRFNAPMVGGKEDVITDLAVDTSGTIYVISHTELYTASSTDGHVTQVGPVTTCGKEAVALTFTPDGKLYAADYQGAFCRIDLATKPPTVSQIATLANNMAIAGDLVAVGDGTMYGTAYDLTKTSTGNDNILVKIDPATGHLTTIGATGFPKLFGVAFERGQVFGFTHDGSGNVVTIDPATGKGTLYNSFQDSAGKPISFAGAGVNAMVAPTIM